MEAGSAATSRTSGASRIIPRADLEGADPGPQLAVIVTGGGMGLVHVVEHDPLELPERHGTLRRAQVGNRLGSRDDPNTLMDRRQEAAVPDLSPGVGKMLAEHDVGGQVGVERAQTMADPRAQAGHRHGGRARVHRQHSLKMFHDVGMERADHAKFIGHSRPGAETAR